MKTKDFTITMPPVPGFKELPEYKINVKFITPARMKKLDPGGSPCDGFWDTDRNNTIFIDKTITPKRLLWVFFHEMQHAVLDWVGELWTTYEEMLEAEAITEDNDS